CRATRPLRSLCRSRPLWCTTASPSPSALLHARCPSAARARRTREWYRGCSDGRRGRPGRPPWNSRRRHARAIPSRRARRRRGKGSADDGPQTGRAGSLCPWVRQTRNSSSRPATASADARPPTRHGRGSTSSPSRAVADAQPPTPSMTRSGVSSLFFSFLLWPYELSFRFGLLFSIVCFFDYRQNVSSRILEPGNGWTISAHDAFLVRLKIGQIVHLEANTSLR